MTLHSPLPHFFALMLILFMAASSWYISTEGWRAYGQKERNEFIEARAEFQRSVAPCVESIAKDMNLTTSSPFLCGDGGRSLVLTIRQEEGEYVQVRYCLVERGILRKVMSLGKEVLFEMKAEDLIFRQVDNGSLSITIFYVLRTPSGQKDLYFLDYTIAPYR
jgi:hypothetical protein